LPSNNALHEPPPERWAKAISVNLSSVSRLMRAEIPPMLRAGKGTIVNNSSTGGLRDETPAERFGAMDEIAETVDWLLRIAPGRSERRSHSHRWWPNSESLFISNRA